MTSTTKSGKLSQETEASPQTPNSSPLAGPGPGGHKPSFRSTKLARRARSFKDDFLGKISQMRSPGSSGTLALRAQSPKGLVKGSPMVADKYAEGKGPIQELEGWKKQTEIALKHLRDVVAKNKLEMLPGNGTIILDTIWSINLSIKSSINNDKSSSVASATHRVYQTVARLIKLCDDALLDDQSSELKKENVNEIVAQVEDAVKNLIELAQEKINQQHLTSYKTTPRSSFSNCNLENQSQRNSLPDIPLTPREREILAQTSNLPIRNSHSTESILREPESPPPKPPLPVHLRNRSDSGSCLTPPPLPPKKRNQRLHHLVDNDCHSVDSSPICSSLERVSLRSKSPEDSISLLSEGTGSIDSMLNQSSKEEDEIKVLMECDQDMLLDNHTSDIFGIGSNSWEESSLSSGISNHHLDLHTSVNDYHRLSNTDSGIVSIRSSSYSKRSSQQSSVSAQFCSSRPSNENLLDSPSTVLKNFSQKSSSSSSTLVVSNSSHSIISRQGFEPISDELPPAIPQKTKRKTEQRQPSPYDNVPDLDHSVGDNVQAEVLVSCHQHQSQQQSHSQMSSIISNNSKTNSDELDNVKPPPLPPKKKHIMAYMEMFGNCSHTNDAEFMRHSVHMVQSQWGNPSMTSLAAAQSCSFSHSAMHSSSRSSHTQALGLPSHSSLDRGPSPLHSPNATLSSSSSNSSVVPPALPPKQRTRKSSSKSPPPTPTSTTFLQEPKTASLTPSPNQIKSLPDLLEHTASKSSEEKPDTPEVSMNEVDLMEKLNVEDYLVLKKLEEDGPEIRGGSIDALIIQATKATKNGVFAYQEAFLTTYRTFISPFDLITKLVRRYNHFYYQQDKKPRSREAFALIVRVVSDLTTLDLDEALTTKLMNFVQHLISCGELILAKALRVKLLERHAAKQMAIRYTHIISSLTLSARNSTLMDFKSEQIAEQMTLLDAELFMKIEIPEVLIWAQEQNEERSPNLTRFTEHFNKMSYWARTRILTAETKEIREKYFMKFIKIMKHLRKINNFNSYLALLSALDSAPVRRLEWQRHVQEGLKEYCALIDSSSSFRAYRMALAETQPPCIPYIGLVLQDLTFVHIGNTNLLPNSVINFSKRWQQFNIVENMKKFKNETYTFKKNEKIIQFFQNFNDCIGEDAMWKLSEKIKPRGKILPMLSPGSSGFLASRAQSPRGLCAERKGLIHELEVWKKQTEIVLQHLRNVVSMKTLEMLPGNGTIVLDTILSIKSLINNDKSSSIVSAMHRVYQNLARLIKLCDDALLDNKSSQLKKENVNEIVAHVEDAVKNLVELAQEKVNQQLLASYKTTHRQFSSNQSQDIPLTMRETEIFAQTSNLPIRNSRSSESLLNESDSPPPKPSLPVRSRNRSDSSSSLTPPPLPPKKRNQRLHHHVDNYCHTADSSPICSSLQRVSLRSKSLDGLISLPSEGSGSTDSILNQFSKEEDIKVFTECDHDMHHGNHTSDTFDRVISYMEIFGNCSYANDAGLMRPRVYMVKSQRVNSSMTSLAAVQSCSLQHCEMHSSSRNAHKQAFCLPSYSSLDRGSSPLRSLPLRSPNAPLSRSPSNSSLVPPALPPRKKAWKIKSLPDLLEHTANKSSEEKPDTPEVNKNEIDLMEKLNVEDYFILKKPDDEGSQIMGGSIDALIIEATKSTRIRVSIYQEAFLTTYRTFISPFDLITKLIRRYNHFYYQQDKKPESTKAFALVVRVVSDLTTFDLNEVLTTKLMTFVQHLISCGELIQAKALRVKLLEKHAAKRMAIKYTPIIRSLTLNARNSTLMDFKLEQIAEQMTLLDEELFMKIEIPEVLIWAPKQNKERCPNLTRFAEHFNKISYWARTRILTAETKEVREKYFIRFLNIIQHLRKINNFNSYLALLSALNSTPIWRLEWPRYMQEILRECCALIDPSSSFKAYRGTLANTQPPCIPYIGLILQDLTFVHTGNKNLLPDGSINFSKRWKQFKIIENMQKCRHNSYDLEKNEEMIQFFQDFNDCIGEEAMWKLSQKIKPGGGKKLTERQA